MENKVTNHIMIFKVSTKSETWPDKFKELNIVQTEYATNSLTIPFEAEVYTRLAALGFKATLILVDPTFSLERKITS